MLFRKAVRHGHDTPAGGRADLLQRSVSLVATATVAALILAGVALESWYSWQRSRHDLAARAENYAALAAPWLSEAVQRADRPAAGRALSGLVADAAASAAVVALDDGTVFASAERRDGSAVPPLGRMLAQDPRLQHMRSGVAPLQDGLAAVATLRLADGAAPARLAFAMDYSAVDAAALGDFLFMLAEALFSVAIAALVLNRLLGRVVAPLDRLALVMRISSAEIFS